MQEFTSKRYTSCAFYIELQLVECNLLLTFYSLTYVLMNSWTNIPYKGPRPLRCITKMKLEGHRGLSPRLVRQTLQSVQYQVARPNRFVWTLLSVYRQTCKIQW